MVAKTETFKFGVENFFFYIQGGVEKYSFYKHLETTATI